MQDRRGTATVCNQQWIKRDGTATMSNTEHVGMLLQESFIAEGNIPWYGNTMPEFVELQGDDDSNEEDDNSTDIVEASPIMEKMATLSEEAVDNIMACCHDEFEMSLKENCGELMVPFTFLSFLEDKVKEIKSLFQAGNYNNNLFDLKSI